MPGPLAAGEGQLGAMLDESGVGRALRAVSEVSPYGVAVVAANGVLLHVNPAMAALLGTGAQAVLGQPVTRYVHRAERAGDQSPHDDGREWRGRRMRRRVVREDGTESVVTVLVTPVEDPSLPAGLAVVQVLPDADETGSGTSTPSRVPLRVVQARAVEEAAIALMGAVTVAQVTAVLEQQVEAFEAEGLLIALASGRRLRIVSSRGYDEDVVALLADQPMDSPSPMVDAVNQHAPVFLETFEQYVQRYPGREDLARRSGKQAWAFLPMVAGGQAIGSWCLSFTGPHRFTISERALLTTLSGLLAQAVARCDDLEAERSMTRTLQQSMLPHSLPSVPGCEIEVRYASSSGLLVGGDFYDVVPLPGGGTGIVIGDAQGHSASAAALMGQVRAALRAYAAEGHDPATIVARASRFLVTADVDSFVTCTYLALDATGDGVSIVRAGHPEPVLVTPDGSVGALEVPGGLPLGIDPQAAYPVTWVPLTVGCRLVLYTDGLVEQRDVGVDVGERALLARIRAGSALPLGELADALLGPDQARDDDVALLVLDRVPGTDSGDVRQATFTAASTEPEAVRRVRREVLQACRGWGWTERLDEVELMVSEVVTNAIRHVGGGVTVTLTASPRSLTVSVSDSSVAQPSPRAPDALWETGGRGLHIVSELADRWGVDPSGLGKSVWFALDADGDSDATRGARAVSAANA